MKSTVISLAAGALIIAASQACGAEPLKPLQREQIRARLVGKLLSDRVHWSRRLRGDGTMQMTDMGKTGNGRWKLDGNKLCFGRAQEAFDCYEVWTSGAELRLRSPG